MRGPGVKLDLDIRRLWTCPVCHKQRKLPGHITSPRCPCREEGVVMELTAEPKPLRQAERITPLPHAKRPGLAKPVIPEPVADSPTPPPTAPGVSPTVVPPEPPETTPQALESTEVEDFADGL